MDVWRGSSSAVGRGRINSERRKVGILQHAIC